MAKTDRDPREIFNNKIKRHLSCMDEQATEVDAVIGMLINYIDQQSESDAKYALLYLLDDSNNQALFGKEMRNALWLKIPGSERHAFINWFRYRVSKDQFADFLDYFSETYGIENLTDDFSRTDDFFSTDGEEGEGDSLIHMFCNSKLPKAIDYLTTLWDAQCFTSEMTIQHNNAGQTPLHCVLQTYDTDNEDFGDLFTFLLSVHAGEVDLSIVDLMQRKFSPVDQLLYCYEANRFDYMQVLDSAFRSIPAVEDLINNIFIDKNIEVFEKLLEMPAAREKLTELFNRQPTNRWQNFLSYVPFIGAGNCGYEDTKIKNPLADIILSNDVEFFQQVRDALNRSELQINLRLIDYARWLCIAAARGNLSMVQALYTICNCLPENNDDDHRFWLTESQSSPLDFSILGGHLPVVKFFVEEAKIDVNLLKVNSRGEISGPSSIAAAIASGKVEILAYLINEANADVNPKGGHFFMHGFCADCDNTVAYFTRRYGALTVSAKFQPPMVKRLTRQFNEQQKEQQKRLKELQKRLNGLKRSMTSKTLKQKPNHPSYFETLMTLCRYNFVGFDYPDALKMMVSFCNRESLNTDTDPHRTLVIRMLKKIHWLQMLIAEKFSKHSQQSITLLYHHQTDHFTFEPAFAPHIDLIFAYLGISELAIQEPTHNHESADVPVQPLLSNQVARSHNETTVSSQQLSQMEISSSRRVDDQDITTEKEKILDWMQSSFLPSSSSSYLASSITMVSQSLFSSEQHAHIGGKRPPESPCSEMGVSRRKYNAA